MTKQTPERAIESDGVEHDDPGSGINILGTGAILRRAGIHESKVGGVVQEIDQLTRDTQAGRPLATADARSPTIGRIVRYRLSDADVAAINKRREDFTKSRASLGDTGMQAHWGRPAIPGADMAAIVVAEIDDSAGQDIALQVFLVGNDTLYVESPEQGPRPGQWHWPVRV